MRRVRPVLLVIVVLVAAACRRDGGRVDDAQKFVA
jgi:hypothetical protein